VAIAGTLSARSSEAAAATAARRRPMATAAPDSTSADDADDAEDGREDASRLPPHLSVLIGSLKGPPDLGRNHDKYLTYPHRDESGGAESA
jgi:hypothetical protein